MSSTSNGYVMLTLVFAREVMPRFNGSLRGINNSSQRMVEDNRLGRLPVARPGAVRVDGDANAAR